MTKKLKVAFIIENHVKIASKIQQFLSGYELPVSFTFIKVRQKRKLFPSENTTPLSSFFKNVFFILENKLDPKIIGTCEISEMKWDKTFEYKNDFDSITRYLRENDFDVAIIDTKHPESFYINQIADYVKEGVLLWGRGENKYQSITESAFNSASQQLSSMRYSIYHQKNSQTKILSLLNGACTTQLTFGRTVFRAYNESLVWLIEIINNLLATSNLEPIGTPFASDIELSKKLSFLRYTKHLSKEFKKRYFKRSQINKEWTVNIYSGNWDELSKSSKTVTTIPNPANSHFADPFLFEHDNKTICFLEEYNRCENKAVISAFEITEQKNKIKTESNSRLSYSYLGKILEEPFNLAFPFVFSYDEKIYMVPDSRKANSIRLYECKKFPMIWELKHELMTNVSAVDSTIFEHKGLWWLSTTIKPDNSDELCAALHFFFAEKPTENCWIPHPKNPVVLDHRVGRNGGFINSQNRILRVNQIQGFESYGLGVAVSEILELTTSNYKENKPILFNEKVHGHHLSSIKTYTAYDSFK